MYLHSNKSRISVFKAKISPLDKAEVDLIINWQTASSNYAEIFTICCNLEREPVNLHSDIYLFTQTTFLAHSNSCEPILKGITKISNKWHV